MLPQNQEDKQSQFGTTDSITDIIPHPSLSIYFSQNLHAVLAYTLKNQISIDWLQTQQQQIVKIGSNNYLNNVEEHTVSEGFQKLEEKVFTSLSKVQTIRSALNSKQMKSKLFDSSRILLKKQVIKANLLKYRCELMKLRKTVKDLDQIYEEQQIQNCQYTDGVLCIGPLLHKSLQKCWKKHSQNNIPFKTSKHSTIRAIIEYEMNFFQIPKQYLYSSIKAYIKIKNYLISSQPTLVDELCQQNINKYWKQNITRIEFEKSQSLAQSSPTVRQYFHNTTSIMRQHLSHSVKSLIQQLNLRLSQNNGSFKENIDNLFRQVQNSKYLFDHHSFNNLNAALIISYLNWIMLPLIQSLCSYRKAQKSRKQRKYQKIRIIHLYFIKYTQIIENFMQQINVYRKCLTEQWKCEFWTAKQVIHNKLMKKNNGIGKLLCYWKAGGQKQTIKVLEEGNQIMGDNIIYLESKIQSLLLKSLKPQNQTISVINELKELSISIVSQFFTQKLQYSKQFETTSVQQLKNIKFSHYEIAQKISIMFQAYVEEIYHLQRIVNQIEDQTHKEAKDKNNKQANSLWNWMKGKKKGKNSQNSFQIQEECYKKLMGVNLKTFKYLQMMKIARSIGVQEELNTIHQELYSFFQSS